jgi:glycosyltransferase involved in cell wall biosynthesis
MKILMLSDLYSPFLGGIERHVQSLSKALGVRGHKVVVGTIGGRGLPRYEEEGQVEVHRLEGIFQRVPFVSRDTGRKWHPPARNRWIGKKLAEIIEEESPDIIHAHGWIVYSAANLRRRYKIPLVYTIHDYRLFCPNMLMLRGTTICDGPSARACLGCVGQRFGLLRALFAYCGVRGNRKSLRYIDHFIAVSDFVRETNQRQLRLDAARITTIPNFCDPGSGNGRGRDQDLPDDFVLNVGWLMPHKGVDVLIEAFRSLNVTTKLLIIGIEHPDFSYEGSGNVMVLRNAPHSTVMEAFSKCRFAVFPSICPETASTVALEAMSQSRAVIASDIGGLGETVVDRETGILVCSNDAVGLSDAISYLLENSGVAAQMGKSGHSRYVQNFTPDAVVPRIVDVYERLAN